MSSRSSGGVAKADASTWAADPLIGKLIDGRYRIEAVLGTGGVGVVYRAEHLTLQRQVAIKVLHEKLGSIDELRRRFEREGKALSTLTHPNVVAVNDYGIADGMPFLVMELLQGRTLADLIDDDGPPDIDIVLDIAAQVLRGLAFAHGFGIVHRDLKAANVFLQALPDAPNHVKLLDFGLAKIFTTEIDAGDPTLTKAGTILGTPAYMSPEQATGSSVDERADVYSAGVLLFEMLTGRYPFEAPTRADMLRAHMLDAVPDPETARAGLTVVPELRALVDKAMAKDKIQRFQTASAMLDALEALPPIAAWVDSQAASGEVARASGPVRHERAEDKTIASSGSPVHRGSGTTERERGGPSLAVLATVALGLVLLVAAGGLVLAPTVESPTAPNRVASAPAPASAEEPSSASGSEPVALDEITVEPEAPADVAVEPVEPPSAAVASGTRPAARDPFVGVALPESLRPYHRKVRAGRRLTTRDRQAIMLIQRSRPGDPRPTLVLAHHYVDITYYSDALARYEQAHAMDPSCRGDRRMLRDIVNMALALSRPVSERATELLRTIYGEEATRYIDREIRGTRDALRVGRLSALRGRL